MRHLGVPTGEALDEVQDASFVDTVANLDDIAALVHRSVVFVHLDVGDGDRSQGRGHRNKQAEEEG